MVSKSLLITLICCYITFIFAQENKDYLKMIRKEPYTKMRKWIQCDVCKAAMLQSNRRSRSMRDALKDKALEEEHYFNITKYSCQPYHEHGEWILRYDIENKGNRLKVVEHDGFGRCFRECESIAYACQAIIDEFQEEIQEYLYSKISTAKLQKKICKKACKKQKNKPPIEDEWGSEIWEEIAEDQRGMFKNFVMGQLYKREIPPDENEKHQDDIERQVKDWIDQQEAEKQHIIAKRKYDNKMRAKKGLPLLPELTEDDINIFEEEDMEKGMNGTLEPKEKEEEGEEDGDGDTEEEAESAETTGQKEDAPQPHKIDL